MASMQNTNCSHQTRNPFLRRIPVVAFCMSYIPDHCHKKTSIYVFENKDFGLSRIMRIRQNLKFEKLAYPEYGFLLYSAVPCIYPIPIKTHCVGGDKWQTGNYICLQKRDAQIAAVLGRLVQGPCFLLPPIFDLILFFIFRFHFV